MPHAAHAHSIRDPRHLTSRPDLPPDPTHHTTPVTHPTPPAAVQVPFFAELSDAKIGEAAQAAELATHNKGDVLIEKGDAGEHFYVVVNGEVRIDIKEEGATEKKLGAGHYFGEFSMLAQRPALATCSVLTDKCTLLKLQRDAFLELFADDTVSADGPEPNTSSAPPGRSVARARRRVPVEWTSPSKRPAPPNRVAPYPALSRASCCAAPLL